MLHDLAVIFYCWFLSSLWLFLTLPVVSKYTKKIFVDGGWAMNRATGWLIIGLPVWFLAHFGIPINTKPGIWIVFGLLLMLSLYYWKKSQFNFAAFFQEKKAFIITEELLFIFGFFFLSIIRGFSPEINNLEKFMDAGLVISYIKSPVLPIEDMWLAGMSFNYYTFGHFLGAVATQFWSIDPAISYNISLGLIMGLSLALSFSVVVNILSQLVEPTEPLAKRVYLAFHFVTRMFHHSDPLIKRPSLPTFLNKKNSYYPLIAIGIIGAYLVNFAGNTQTIWYIFARCYSQHTQTEVNFSPADENGAPVIADECSFAGYWYPNATRFIPRTIHEFPSYSFIVSDLHAHVWNLVQVLNLLLIVMLWSSTLLKLSKKETEQDKKEWLALTGIIGVLMGVFVMTSTWDALVYSLFLGILSTGLLVNKPNLLFKLMTSGFLVVVTMVITSSAWWLNFDSISEGAALANEHTVWWQLVVLWLAHVLIGIIGAYLTVLLMKKKGDLSFAQLMVFSLVFSGIALIILPELFYIKDIYETQPRANTMFKLTYQAFIQLGLVMAVTLGLLFSNIPLAKPIKRGLALIVIALLLSISIYPYYGYRDFYLGLNATYQTLDGMQWLKDESPSEYEAYLWLKQIEGRPRILEAVGDSYTTFNRFSAFTGLPTVLGWRVHEWLWRGSYDIAGERSAEVESIYLNPSTEESQRLLNQYLVKYVIVGLKEREAYPQLNTVELKKLGKVVFEDGDTFIVER